MYRLAFLFCLFSLIITATPVKYGGSYFTSGCGQAPSSEETTGSYYLPPLVNDKGDCAVIAADPAVNIPRLSRGVWRFNHDQPATPIAVFTGVSPLISDFYYASSALQGSADLSQLWSVSEDFVSSASKKIRLWDSATSKHTDLSSISKNLQIDSLYLQVASDNDTALLFDSSLQKLWLCSLSDLSSAQLLELENFSGTALPCLAENGQVIYFLGLPYGSSLYLYRYDLQTKTIETVAEAVGTKSELGVTAGHQTPSVACSDDGTTIVYRYYDATAKNTTLRIAMRHAANDYTYTTMVGTDGQTLATTECHSPALSFDGRFLAFIANASNAPLPNIPCLYRYELQQRKLLAVTDASFQANLHVPAISPNGRHVAFIAQQATDSTPQLYGNDCGISLCMDAELTVQRSSSAVLSMTSTMTATEAATATLSFSAAALTEIHDAGGNTLQAGMAYPWSSLPWSVVAGTRSGTESIALSLSTSTGTASATVRIQIPNDFEILLTPADSSGEFSDFAIDAAADRLLFSTNLALQDDDDTKAYDIYSLSLETNELSNLTNDESFKYNTFFPQISGNGQRALWFDVHTALWTQTDDAPQQIGGDCTFSQNLFQFAVSYNGAVIATIDSADTIQYSSNGGASFAPIPLPEVYQAGTIHSLLLSQDGMGIIALLTLNQQNYLAVLDNSEWTVSPVGIDTLCAMLLDGQRIFAHDKTDGWILYDILTHQQTNTPVPASLSLTKLSVAANGRYVYYTYENHLYRVDLAAGSPYADCLTQVAGDAPLTSLQASWNGRQLFFASQATNLTAATASAANKLFCFTDNAFSNQQPVVGKTALATDEDTPVIWSAADFAISDGDGDAVMIGVTQHQTRIGTVQYIYPNRIQYTPNQDANGMDSFGITLFDGTDTTTATITVTVHPVNDAPVWSAPETPTGRIDAGNSLTIDFSARDVDGDALSYAITGSTYASIDPNGCAVFTPSFDQADNTLFYTISCSDGTTSIQQSFTLTVLPIQSQAISAALLFGTGDSSSLPTQGALADWYNAINGCWNTVVANGGWQALSIPGADADIALLCQAFGATSIQVYEEGCYRQASSGTLAAGQGFWVKPGIMDSTAVLSITPALTPDPDMRFVGPTMPENAVPVPLYEVDSSHLRRTDTWKVGTGYFR